MRTVWLQSWQFAATAAFFRWALKGTAVVRTGRGAGWGGWEDWLCEDKLGSGLVVLDVADCVLQNGEFVAGTTWIPILADGGLPEFDFAPIRVAVDVDVCDAHCLGGEAYSFVVWTPICSGFLLFES